MIDQSTSIKSVSTWIVQCSAGSHTSVSLDAGVRSPVYLCTILMRTIGVKMSALRRVIIPDTRAVVRTDGTVFGSQAVCSSYTAVKYPTTFALALLVYITVPYAALHLVFFCVVWGTKAELSSFLPEASSCRALIRVLTARPSVHHRATRQHLNVSHQRLKAARALHATARDLRYEPSCFLYTLHDAPS